jgi:hypothetical protein
MIKEDENENSPLNSLPFDFKDEIEERFNESESALKSRRVLIEGIKTAEYKANKEEKENNKKNDNNFNKDKRLIKKRKRDTIIPR